MDSKFTSLSYDQKRTYILTTLKNFSSRGATFANLYERISLDTQYPEEKLDFIAEKFAYYKDATNRDKQQENKQKLQSILQQEQPTSEEELEQILSKL